MNQNFREKINSIFLVAFPLIIQGLVYQLQSLTDKAFLGNLDTIYVSAAGAAQMPYVATIDSMVAVSTGVILIVSKLAGAKRENEIPAYVKSTAFYSTIIDILVFILWFSCARTVLYFFNVDSKIISYSISYIRICLIFLLFVGIDSSLQAMLQGMGKTRPIMYAGLLKVGLNIFVSWVLIFGKLGFPKMNVTGAAVGTLTANFVSFFFILIYCLLIKKDEFHLTENIKECLNKAPFIKIIRPGIPVGAEYLLWNVSNLILIRFINSFGYTNMAIYTLTFGFQCIVYVIFEGTSKATLSLMGQSIGANRHDIANQLFHITIFINFVIVGVAAISFFCFPAELLSIFSNDAALIHNGMLYLKWIGIIMIPQSMNVICGNAIRANDDTKWMLLSQILGSILVISISWYFIQVLHLNMLAVYVTLFLDESIRGCINYIYYRRRYGTLTAPIVC